MQSNELSLEQIFLRLTEMSDEEQKKIFVNRNKRDVEVDVEAEIMEGEDK